MRHRGKSQSRKETLKAQSRWSGTRSEQAVREDRGLEKSAQEVALEEDREWLLAQIGEGARHCKEIEAEFGKNPAPELETLIKLHRVMVLQLSSEGKVGRETIGVVTALMRPVMEWARLQEKRKTRELAEEKHRAQVEAEKAAKERELEAANSEGGLSPETLEKIERELRLM